MTIAGLGGVLHALHGGVEGEEVLGGEVVDPVDEDALVGVGLDEEGAEVSP